MPFSNRPWSEFSESDYKTAEQFCSACLIDLNPPGKPKVKELCKLPVKEPGGTYNRNGIHAAAVRIHQTHAPREEKRKAARKLIRLYREMGEEPPDSLKRLAK